MSPELINQRIAEKCGWTRSEKGWWSHPTLPDNGGAEPLPPDYFYDRNAIIEAIKEVILGNVDLERAFIKNLNVILERRADDDAGPVICEYEMAQLTADSDEFCEAFLKTVGGWEEAA